MLIDALRADRLGCYGGPRDTSPHLDALAADGTRFADAVSPSPWTLPTMASIWTSLYPSIHGASRASDIHRAIVDGAHFRPSSTLHASRTTLAEVLAAGGLRTAAFVDGAYPGRTFGMDQGFDTFVEDEHLGVRFNTEALLAWWDAERPERFFAYLHVAEVHSPYTAMGLPEAARGDDPEARRLRAAVAEENARYAGFAFDPDYDGPLDGSWRTLQRLQSGQIRPSPRDVEHLLALYDQGIAYTDFWVGALLDGLRARGLYDDTIVVVTSDHGDEFFEHGSVEHGKTYYEEMLRVPLVLRVPGAGRGRVVEQQVGLIDLMPTLLDLLGVAYTGTVQGRSLRPLLAGEALPERPQYAEARIHRQPGAALRGGGSKYVADGRGGGALYDLNADPGEQRDLCAASPDRCAAYRRRLERWRADNAALAERLALPAPRPAVIDDATRQRLKELGYSE